MKIRNKTQNIDILNQEEQPIQKSQQLKQIKTKIKTEIQKHQNHYGEQSRQFIKSAAIKSTQDRFTLPIAKTNQGISFCKAKRAITQRTDFDWRPSPHQYHYQSCQNKKRSPKFSFSKQKKYFKTIKQEKNKKQIPGPGKYEAKCLQKIVGDVIGTQARMSKLMNINNPGVGLYHIQRIGQIQKKGLTFQKSSRSNLQKNTCAPGPNKYEISKISDLKSFRQTFGRSKRLAEILSSAPGIGTYKIQNYKKRHSTSVRFTTSPRQSKRSKQKELIPGPGKYEVAPVIKFKQQSKMQSAIFGTQDRQRKIQIAPGPADYNNFINGHKKGISLTGRNFYTHIEKVPGSGEYSPDYTKIIPKAQTARIGKQGKFRQSNKIIPGPSYYEPQRAQKALLRHSGFIFPKSSRQKLQFK